MAGYKTHHGAVMYTTGLSVGYIGKRGKACPIHDDLNLTLNRGDFICLTGPNGCGKTTLIRTLSGIQKPVGGKIFFGSRPFRSVSIPERSKLIGVVLTEKTTVGNMLVEEIVALGRYAHTNWIGTLGITDRKVIEQSMRQTGLIELRERTFGTLSDGERQRTFIARALASEAPLLLLDEPTAHLDIPARVEIMLLLHRLTRENNQTMLVSTHNLDLAMQLADVIWLMHPKGGITAGIPEEIALSGRMNELFGGREFEFTALNGSVTLRHKKTATIAVTGHNERFHLLKPALARIGIEAVDPGMSENTVNVSGEIILLRFEGEEHRFESLDSLLRTVRQLNEKQESKNIST